MLWDKDKLSSFAQGDASSRDFNMHYYIFLYFRTSEGFAFLSRGHLLLVSPAFGDVGMHRAAWLQGVCCQQAGGEPGRNLAEFFYYFFLLWLVKNLLIGN